MKRFFAFSALIVCSVLIQSTILSNWYVLPAVPDIVLLIVIYTAFRNGSTAGQVSGFFSGLLLDFVSAAPLGLNALIRTIMGFAGGLLYRTLETHGVFVPVVLGFVSTVGKAITIGCISFFYPGSVLTYSLFSSIFWYECLFNALCAPLVFRFLSFFAVFSTDLRTESLN